MSLRLNEMVAAEEEGGNLSKLNGRDKSLHKATAKVRWRAEKRGNPPTAAATHTFTGGLKQGQIISYDAYFTWFVLLQTAVA